MARFYRLTGPDGKIRDSRLSGKWGGHRGTHIYGRLDCASALRALARGGYVSHRVFFRKEADAISAGYRPCAVCLPEKYQRWKLANAGKLKRRRAG